MVDFDDVSFAYKGTEDGVTNLSFHIDDGQLCFITGRSGSGKSTLSKLLTGELRPDTGKVVVNGFCMNGLGDKRLAKARRTIGMVFQDFRLIPDMTAYENLEFSMRCVNAPEILIPQRIKKVLSIVGLTGKEGRLPEQMSGGEQQRVAIARAIINHPRLIVADEPTGNLDPELADEIIRLLSSLREEENAAVIVVTHAVDIVRKYRARVIHMENGSAVFYTEKEAVVSNEKR